MNLEKYCSFTMGTDEDIIDNLERAMGIPDIYCLGLFLTFGRMSAIERASIVQEEAQAPAYVTTPGVGEGEDLGGKWEVLMIWCPGFQNKRK